MSEIEIGLALVKFAGKPTPDELAKCEKYDLQNPYTNYFYKTPRGIGLCVPNSTQLQTEVANIEHCIVDDIFFGYNTDPVHIIPLKEVLSTYTASACEYSTTV